jgi:hypothetical protein
MKLKLLLLISILQLSLDSESQIFNNEIRFGMEQETADSIKHSLSKANMNGETILEFCGSYLKTSLSYNHDWNLLINGPVREVNYLLNSQNMQDIIKEKPLPPTNEEKKNLKAQYNNYFLLFWDKDGYLNNIIPYAIDTVHFNKIIDWVIEKGFSLDSVNVDKEDGLFRSKYYYFSDNNQIIILSRNKQLFKPNYFFNYWHFGDVQILEKSSNYDLMKKEEKEKNLEALNIDNFFDPFFIKSSYDKSKSLQEKKIHVEIELSDKRKCKKYKPTGIDYIDGSFIIKDVFGKVLHSIDDIQFNVKKCMPRVPEDGGYLQQCSKWNYSFSPDDNWSMEFLKHLANDYDIEVTYKVNRIRFEDGEIWE